MWTALIHLIPTKSQNAEINSNWKQACNCDFIIENREYYFNRCNHVWHKSQWNLWKESETMQFIKILQSTISTGKIQTHIQKLKCRIPYFKWRKENILNTFFTNIKSIVTFLSNKLTDFNTLLKVSSTCSSLGKKG